MSVMLVELDAWTWPKASAILGGMRSAGRRCGVAVPIGHDIDACGWVLVPNFRKLCSLFPLLSAIVVVLEMEQGEGRYPRLGGATAHAVDLISWSSGSDRMPNFGMVNLLVEWWPYKNFLVAWRRREGRQIHYISVFAAFCQQRVVRVA
jgi:hypothetical protein